jgi:hypothetical protein
LLIEQDLENGADNLPLLLVERSNRGEKFSLRGSPLRARLAVGPCDQGPGTADDSSALWEM